MRASASGVARLLATLAALGPVSARPADVNARADLSYGDEEADLSSSRFYRQRYEVDLRHAISEAIRYGAQLRFQEDQGRTWTGPLSSGLHQRSAAARGDLGWSREDYGLTSRYELDWARNLELVAPGGADRWLQRALLQGYWRFTPPADLRASWDHTDVGATSITRPYADDRASVGASLTLPGLRAFEENRYQRTDDGAAERTRIGPSLSLDWSRDFGGGTTATARYLGDWGWIQERTLSGVPVRFAVEVTAAGGLFAWNNLPADTTGTPMQPTPGLVDRNFSAGAGIPVGPTGTSFQNVGLDLGRVAAVDELRVSVRSSTGSPLPYGGLVSWTTWWSNDGAHWVQAGGDTTTFDTTLSAWIVGFTTVSARYVKVVNFGTHSLDAQVTELQAFAHDTVRPEQERRSTSILQSLAVAGTWRPAERLQLSYAGALNATGVATSGTPMAWSSDDSHALSARGGPFDQVTLQLDLSRWESRQSGQLPQRSLGSTATATWKAWPRAELAAVAHAAATTSDGATATTWGGGTRGRLGLYEAIQLAAGVDYNRQELAGGSTDYLNVTAGATLRPRSDLDLGGSVGLQRITSRAGAPSAAEEIPLLKVYQYERYQADATWRAADQLQLGLRIGFLRTDQGSGLLQSVRVQWSPLRSAAVQVTGSYDEQVDPLTGRTFRRLQLLPRWTLNAHASLQLNYNRIRESGGGSTHQDALYVTFVMRT